jgi:hypothetical protein
MRAIWLVRRQELAMRIRFWTAIVGYDPRDRSLRNYIYLLYVLIFLGIWGFAVLTLLADAGSTVLGLVGGLSPSSAAVLLLAGALLLVTLIQGYRAGVRSPFLFSDTDAELICQTPVDRSKVALAWFLGDWVAGGLLFSALAVVLRFASLQMVIPGGFTWPLLPRFLIAGVLTTGIVFPLNLALSALVYALGALRLQGEVENRWVRWIPVGVGLALVFVASGRMPLMQIFLWPVLFPLEVALRSGSWLPGFNVAVVLASLALLALYVSGRGLNLSRAAQESRSRYTSRQLALLGVAGRGQAVKARHIISPGHTPRWIPAGEGLLSFIWKGSLTAIRLANFSAAITWLGICGVSLAMLVASDWGTRLWAFVIWGLEVAQCGTAGLKTDLRVWSLTRQLPFSARQILLAECIAPASAILLISWLSLAIIFLITHTAPLFLFFLFPPAVFCVVFSAAYDVLRQCHTSELLAGQVAEPGAGGLILGLILAGSPILLVSWLVGMVYDPILGVFFSFLGLFFGVVFGYGIWTLASHAYTFVN